MKAVAVILIIVVGLYLVYKKFNHSKEQEMSVKIEKTAEVTHGDHWRAMYGFSDDMEKSVEDSFDDLEFQEEINSNLIIYKASYGKIENIAIADTEGLITFFPKLTSKKVISVDIDTIVEWTPTDGLEANIKGRAKGGFGFGFFATDYAKNRKLYKKGGTQNIALSAFAYVIDSSNISEQEEINGITFAKDFCGYFPSQQLDTGYDFDFIGQVLSVETIDYRDEKFYLIDVKLINTDELSFVIPMAVNVKNMRIDKIEVGDSISGAFWLQGEII